MSTTIDFNEAKKNKELRRIRSKSNYSEEMERQGTFVARFSYPLNIGDIINFIERMGVVGEEKILPVLYKIQRDLDVEFKEEDKD